MAAGTYTENITLVPQVALYGGFAGTETALSQRDRAAHATVLDGNAAGSVVTAPPGATKATRIDGFTIRNGTGTLVAGHRYGGGIYCYNTSTTIANNTITDNHVELGGGGIYCEIGAPIFVNNVVTANSAPAGGGVHCASPRPWRSPTA